MGRIDGRRHLGDHRDLGRVHRQAGALEVGANALELGRLDIDLDEVALGVDVRCPGVDGEERDVVRCGPTGSDRDDAARLELPGHAARPGELATVLAEDRADVRRRAVAVVRRAFDQDGRTARTVALVEDLLVALGLAGA